MFWLRNKIFLWNALLTKGLIYIFFLRAWGWLHGGGGGSVIFNYSFSHCIVMWYALSQSRKASVEAWLDSELTAE